MIQFQHWIHQWHFWVICTRICCFNFTFLEVAEGWGGAVAVIIRLNENIHKWKLLTAGASISSERRYLNKIFPCLHRLWYLPLLFLLQWASVCRRTESLRRSEQPLLGHGFCFSYMYFPLLCPAAFDTEDMVSRDSLGLKLYADVQITTWKHGNRFFLIRRDWPGLSVYELTYSIPA